MRAPLAAVLLLSASLAGCLATTPDAGPQVAERSVDAADLSTKRFDILPAEEVWLAMDDGTRIHNAVYRPDTDAPVPVFINFSPYWGDSAMDRGDAFGHHMVEEYVPRGYAVVLSAIRGTGHSEGCFRISGDRELRDLNRVVDRFADAPWSNGKVAAGGKSYDSTPQNGMVAKMPHPALKGLFHVSGITDWYRYQYRQGVPYGHGPIFNTYYYLQGTDEYGASLLGAGDPTDESPASLARLADDVACPELAEMQASGVATGVHGMKTAYWTERDWNRYVPDTTWEGSIFFVHGLQDWNVKPDHILPWLEKLPDDVRVKGWLHQNTFNDGHVYPMRADWNQTMLRWLDHVLKGRDTGIDHGFEVEGSDGTWRRSETWPPADIRAANVPLDLSGGSATVLEAGDGPIRYAGEPTLRVTATAAHGDPVLTAVLYEEDADGEREWTNEAVLRGVLRHGLQHPDPVPVGEAVSYELQFYPQDDVLEPGHRWVLKVGAAPRHAAPWPGQMQGIDYGDVGTLTLPLAPTGTVLDAQPEDVPCFAC